MKTKLLSTSTGMLFFLLLFSKPYVARCQAPSTNEPTKQVVRIEVDTVIKTSDNPNGRKVVIIEDGEILKELEGLGLDTADKDVKVVIIEKNLGGPTAKNKRRNKRNEPMVITKEVRVIKVADDGIRE